MRPPLEEPPPPVSGCGCSKATTPSAQARRDALVAMEELMKFPPNYKDDAAEPKNKKTKSFSSSEVMDDEPYQLHPDDNHSKKECRRGRRGQPRRFSGNNTGFTGFACGQPGHIARDCTQKGGGGTPPGGRDNPSRGNADNQGGEFVTPGGGSGLNSTWLRSVHRLLSLACACRVLTQSALRDTGASG